MMPNGVFAFILKRGKIKEQGIISCLKEIISGKKIKKS